MRRPDLSGLRSWYGSRATAPDRLDLAVTDPVTHPATDELLGEVVLYEWDQGPAAVHRGRPGAVSPTVR